MTEEERKRNYIHKFDVSMQGEVKDNLIVKEFAILHYQQISDNPNLEA